MLSLAGYSGVLAFAVLQYYIAQGDEQEGSIGDASSRTIMEALSIKWNFRWGGGSIRKLFLENTRTIPLSYPSKKCSILNNFLIITRCFLVLAHRTTRFFFCKFEIEGASLVGFKVQMWFAYSCSILPRNETNSTLFHHIEGIKSMYDNIIVFHNLNYVVSDHEIECKLEIMIQIIRIYYRSNHLHKDKKIFLERL